MHITYQRRCLVCRQVSLKSNMLRLCKNHDDITIDETQKCGGRGAYVCKDNACIIKAIDKKLLNRAFKTNVSSEVYDKLRGYIEQTN